MVNLFCVTPIDSITKLIEVEDVMTAKLGKEFQFESVMTGECTMYVARCQNDKGADVAMMAVYVGPHNKLALAGPLYEFGAESLLLEQTCEWLRERLQTQTLVWPSPQPPRLLLHETTLKKSKRGHVVHGMRNAELGVCFKLTQRKKKWNVAKGHWMNRAGQSIERPKWVGENAFVADWYRKHMLSCKSLCQSEPPPETVIPPTLFDARGPTLQVPKDVSVAFKDEPTNALLQLGRHHLVA